MAADPTQLEASPGIDALRAAFDAQRDGFARHPYPDLKERRDNLKLLKSLVLDNRDRIAAAISADFGCRARAETDLAEVLTSVEGIRHASAHLRRWMRPSRRHVGLLFKTTRARVIYQPKGVVGVLVPWNYPLLLALGPATCALAAGNRVLIKMSEFTPRTGELLEQLISDAFPDEVLAVVNGGAQVAAAFSALPFDHLLFTGSTRVGKLVMKSAADNLTPVTLELGGKSPTIIGPDASIEMAAERLAFTKALNAGQTCVAPDYVLLPEHRLQAFVEAFTGAFSAMYRSVRDNEDYTTIINDQQYQRLKGYLDDATAKGARLVSINPAGEKLDPASRKLPLQLVLGATDAMKVMQEEIFGPILPLVPYKSLDQALAFVNGRPRPLALYYFGDDPGARRQLLQQTHSGGVVFNDAVFHVAIDDLPFGGIGPSGMGAYHGKEGFLTFSHAKSVLSRPALLNTAKLMYPPYGKRLQSLIMRLFLR